MIYRLDFKVCCKGTAANLKCFTFLARRSFIRVINFIFKTTFFFILVFIIMFYIVPII